MVLVVALVLIVMLGGGWMLQLEKDRKRLKSEDETKRAEEVSRLKIVAYGSAVNGVSTLYEPQSVKWAPSTNWATGASAAAEITSSWHNNQVVVIWKSYFGVTVKAREQNYLFGADSNFTREQLTDFLVALIEQPEPAESTE